MKTLLVANRGEIAIRVIRSARALGFRTVAIYSDADRDAPHVTVADVAVHVGPTEAAQSYLSIERVIDAAKQCHATHVHPGYGFLSENAAFAEACEAAGLNFVGPSSAAITLMGDKGRARAAMIAAGVPCVPGYQGDDQTDARLVTEAERIGFPIMIKASSGGGGRGLRVANDRAELIASLDVVRSEASRSFGYGSVVLERALSGVRHVEVQVFGDKHGDVIALGERDCSTQRRHQKVIEEAPSPAVNPGLRQRMCDAAVRAAKSANYVGAGTVEMLLDDRGEFYFLEMNTRLQVEHPVTEMITGIDLVQWQLRIADGEALPITQEQVQLNGHAIEVRLYAEDSESFMPQTGTITHLALPQGEGVRLDHALRDGLVVSAHYDPMLGKLIAHGDTREQARTRLLAALRGLRVLGVVTNKALLLRLLSHTTFVDGRVDTGFVAREIEPPTANPTRAQQQREQAVIAAALLHHHGAQEHAPHSSLRYFRSGGVTAMPIKLEISGALLEGSVLTSDSGLDAVLAITMGEQTTRVQVNANDHQRARLTCDGVDRDVAFCVRDDVVEFDCGDGRVEAFDRTLSSEARDARVGNGEVSAPMDGVIVRVDVIEGAAVNIGDALVTIESMKLQHVIRAAIAGRVAFVGATAGAQVKRGVTLVRVEATST